MSGGKALATRLTSASFSARNTDCAPDAQWDGLKAFFPLMGRFWKNECYLVGGLEHLLFSIYWE